MVVQLQGKLK